MLVSNLLRYQGSSLAQHMRRLGVPTSLVDGWQTEWALMTADSDEEDAGVVEIYTRQIQLMTTAQHLVAAYGR